MYVCGSRGRGEREMRARTHTRRRSGVQCNGETRKVVGEVLSSFPAYGWALIGSKAKKGKSKPKRVLTTSFSIPYVRVEFLTSLGLSTLGESQIRKAPHSKTFSYTKSKFSGTFPCINKVKIFIFFSFRND